MLVQGVDAVLDVRSYPGSRRHPHFDREAMEEWLPAAGVAYRWQPALGGRRRAPRTEAGESTGVTDGWETPAFAAYAVAMADPTWLAAAEELIALAASAEAPKVALLCAEALWWRCHRSMIADYLYWRGVDVVHLQPRPSHHADVVDDRLSRYPAAVLEAWERWRDGRLGPDG